ncbi:cyclic nucleotide-binding domain-containing protein [Candidatus Finniella inopinata]|uniref:Cyclic nucleotide-binding domain-containing protein n=1 Tax=Candidatus Finniella inopinata TaxID=1696036 RepID=A0A4Q7DIN4_9PROT|nr:cyclic nucleotide-binding domain-containing protein [Candidatus Finniella inopinata]RZI45844.1 cyclic nucleotide-binding domain-containing protein [Candidatus Finniella inopinata]
MEESGFVSILGHLEYILLIVAFMLRNMVYLRLLTLLSSSLAIVYYSFFLEKPLLINVGWETIFSLVNVYQLLVIAYELYFISFSAEEEKIYKESFSKFSPLQFKKLLKYGKYLPFEAGDYLIKENEPVEKLSFICSGKMEIIHDNKVIAYCKSGNIIGELSFLSGSLATADVKAVEKGVCLFWDQAHLKKLLEKDEEIFAKFQLTFNDELAKKIVAHNS